MSEAIICEGCGRYRNNKFCSYFGCGVKAVACDVFKAKEKPKGVCKDCLSWLRRTLTAGICSKALWSGCSCSGEDFSCNYFEKRPEPAKPKPELDGRCEDCTYWLSHGLCTFHGDSRSRTDGCGEFVRGFGAKESPSTPDKPPLGIMSKQTWEEQRMWDLLCAISRVYEGDGAVKHEWLEELSEKLTAFTFKLK
jgi:hypothetical protein